MKNIFRIKEQYLIFRDQAKYLKNSLFKKMKESRNKKIFLDFSRVIFMSRSFADELLNLVENFALENKKIKLINLPLAVEKLLNVVKKTKKRIEKGVSFSAKIKS